MLEPLGALAAVRLGRAPALLRPAPGETRPWFERTVRVVRSSRSFRSILAEYARCRDGRPPVFRESTMGRVAAGGAACHAAALWHNPSRFFVRSGFAAAVRTNPARHRRVVQKRLPHWSSGTCQAPRFDSYSDRVRPPVARSVLRLCSPVWR